jgi:UTP--glucose-1-phosphate uridylyltransferase
MQMMIKHGYKAYAVPLAEGEVRHDLGTFESYFKSFIDFALKDKKYGYTVRQHLQEIMDEKL